MDTVFGIDIASKSFVVYNEDTGHQEIFNTKRSIDLFLKSLPKEAILVFESTGGYGTLLANRAFAKGLTVYIVQPNKIRYYRRSGPLRSKTDRNDARAIRGYFDAHHKELHPYQPLPAFEARLRQLARSREGLAKHVASIVAMLKAVGDSPKTIEATVSSLRKRMDQIDKEVDGMIKGLADAKVIMSIPGVKRYVTAFVLPILRTIPFRSKHAFVSFVGFDIVLNDSGQIHGRTVISKQGDGHIRKAIYMAAMAAARSKAFKPYYLKIIEEKKLSKIQALVALARKLLRTIYGVFKSQKAFVAPC